MADVNNSYSNYVRFILKSTFKDSLVIKEPIGWKDDDLELDRHKDYHGIFTNFTNNLKFTNEAKEYILNAYEIYGINEDLFLIKQVTKDNGADVVWETRYTANADFSTLVNEETTLSIKFNSNNLAELIKSHESDDFEIETEESIDDDYIGKIQTNKVEIKGRSIVTSGELVLKEEVNIASQYDYINITPVTKFISEGANRLSQTDDLFYLSENAYPLIDNPKPITSSNMFYDFSTVTTADNTISIRYEIDIISLEVPNVLKNNLKIQIVRATYDGESTPAWTEQEFITILDKPDDNIETSYSFKDDISIVVGQNDGLFIKYVGEYFSIKKQRLVVSEVAFFESSPNLDFLFNHDLTSRLLYIITGRNDAYYSKYFGRTDLGYTEDGDGGLIGVMSGLWARAFNRDSEKYKSLTISLKDNLESNHSVFNTGIGIETVNFKERIREEDLKYFYQNEVAVRLPFQISKVKRTVDKDLFFSGMSFGYDKAGDYEDSMGLDEPNTRTDYVTPIRKSTKKFIKTSKIRTDEYGMELARRKPQLTFPDEDTRYDEGNWFLDLKRVDGALGYEQREGYTDGLDITDRLQELPTGIHSPETYRSMHFTPLRMLFRHAWVFRSGMEKYLNKVIKYISAVSNSQLTTWTIGDSQPYAENDDIDISKLERSRFLPEIVEFTHPVDDNLMDLINSKTKLIYGGEEEDIPNVYFKFEYINEKDNLERGYLLNLKPNKEGKWKMQLSNENIII